MHSTLNSTLLCPKCQRSFDVPNTLGGQRTACPHCRQLLMVPTGLPVSGTTTRPSWLIPLLYLLVIGGGLGGVTTVIWAVNRENPPLPTNAKPPSTIDDPPAAPSSAGNTPPPGGQAFKHTFNPTDLAETRSWIEGHLDHLSTVAKTNNELQYSSAVEEVRREFAQMSNEAVTWKFQVYSITDEYVLLKGNSPPISFSNTEHFRMGMTAGSLLELQIGNQIPIDRASKLKQGDLVEITATITDIQGLPEKGDPILGSPNLSIKLGDRSATPARAPPPAPVPDEEPVAAPEAEPPAAIEVDKKKMKSAARLATSRAAAKANLSLVDSIIKVTFNPALEDVKVAGIQIGGLADGQYNIEFLGDVPPALEVCGSLQGLEWHPAVATTYPRGYPVHEGGDLVLMRWKPGEERLDKKFVINFRVSPPRGKMLVSHRRPHLLPGESLDYQPPESVEVGGVTIPLVTDLYIACCYSDGRPIPLADLQGEKVLAEVGDDIGDWLQEPVLEIPDYWQEPRLQLESRLAEPIDVYITTVVYTP